MIDDDLELGSELIRKAAEPLPDLDEIYRPETDRWSHYSTSG